MGGLVEPPRRGTDAFSCFCPGGSVLNNPGDIAPWGGIVKRPANFIRERGLDVTVLGRPGPLLATAVLCGVGGPIDSRHRRSGLLRSGERQRAPSRTTSAFHGGQRPGAPGLGFTQARFSELISPYPPFCNRSTCHPREASGPPLSPRRRRWADHVSRPPRPSSQSGARSRLPSIPSRAGLLRGPRVGPPTLGFSHRGSELPGKDVVLVGGGNSTGQERSSSPVLLPAASAGCCSSGSNLSQSMSPTLVDRIASHLPTSVPHLSPS